MGRKKVSIEGRQRALAELRSALGRCARRGRFVVVRGSAGIGKSRLMDAAAARWRAEGAGAVGVRIDTDADRWGVDGTIEALRRDFDQFSDSGLIEGISALTRLRARESDDPDGWFAAAAAEVSRVFGRIGRLGPTAVLFDDVLGVIDPAALLIATRRPGCLVVASVREEIVATPAATELVSLADEVIDLEPLSDDQISSVAGSELHEEVLGALRVALGPLYGNPGTVLATLAALRSEGRLVSVDGWVRLKESDSAIALPDGHDLLRRSRGLGDLAPRLLAATVALGGLDVDDLPRIADTLGAELGECGRTLDGLVEEGMLVGDALGRWDCLCPALAASAASEEPTAIRRLRAAMTAIPDSEGRDPAGDPAGASGKNGLPRVEREARSAAAGQPWSATEVRIVDLISLGWTNRRIASETGMREKSVERCLTRLFTRTGCRSRVELVTARLEGRSSVTTVRAPAYGPAA